MDELASWSRFPPALVNGRVLAFLERFRAGAPLPPLIKVLFLLGRASFLILSFLSPPLPSLSLTSRRLLSSFAACLRLLSLAFAFAFAIPGAAAVYTYNCEWCKPALVRWLLVTFASRLPCLLSFCPLHSSLPHPSIKAIVSYIASLISARC